MSQWLAKMEQAPRAGIFCLVVVFMGLALGHSLLVLQRYFTGPPSSLDTVISMVLGSVGVALVWHGLKKEENQATWLGYIGGILIWTGWFEWTWEYFSYWLALQPVMDGDIPVLSPGLLMIQSTALIVILLLIMFGANKDTRCRMFMWFHRNLRLRPGKMTAGYKRQHARNTALETIFLTWFIYLCAIMINDPRLIGYDSTAAMVITVGFVAWGLYLVPKLAAIRGLGPALRYAIPTGNILWLPTEAFSRWGLYPEVWIKPIEYSWLMGTALIAFVVAAVVILQSRGVVATQNASG
ncbi:MAG: hypothetical protein R3F24_06035 [Gammaproteobacteria bacterium]